MATTITSEELPRHLASGLKPLYVVFGDALLLAIEAADGIGARRRIYRTGDVRRRAALQVERIAQ